MVDRGANEHGTLPTGTLPTNTSCTVLRTKVGAIGAMPTLPGTLSVVKIALSNFMADGIALVPEQRHDGTTVQSGPTETTIQFTPE